MNADHVKVTNTVSESAQKQTPQLLRDLEVPTRHHFPSKFNKNSQEFIANVPNLNFNVQNMLMPGLQSVYQTAPGFKDTDTPPNTNNYSNNTFSQTIYVNPLTGFLDQGQSQPPSFGMTAPVHPQASMSAAYLQSQLPYNPMLHYNPMLYSQYYMPQYNPYMQVAPQEEEEQEFDNDLTDEQVQFIAMFEMLKDTMMQESDDVEQPLQEQNFESDLAEAEVFQAELKDCQCCHGYPLKCRGDICANLGTCHCALRKTKEQEEASKDKFFVEEHRSCNCCRGYVFACTGAACKLSGRCKCDDE